MNISQLKESKFLKKEDCGPGILVTIRSVEQVNVAKEGAPEEMKWTISFNEVDKPMVLNSTNGQIIAQITKSDESENWTGHKVVLYHDPNIAFGGKLVGGIRVRAPRNQTPAVPKTAGVPTPAPRPAPAPEQPPQEPDDVPF
jgi:hypothetical protein